MNLKVVRLALHKGGVLKLSSRNFGLAQDKIVSHLRFES